MGFHPRYDYPEFEMHLVISVKTGQKATDLLLSWRGLCLMARVTEFNGWLLAKK
jgi:hypothetical protein